jgi:hypothetical protein
LRLMAHGKKRRSYTRIAGHLFPEAKKARLDALPKSARSLCGLTPNEAREAVAKECAKCNQAKGQLWA